MKKLRYCLYCGNNWNINFYPFCSVECQKNYKCFYNSILQHRKKGDLKKWIEQDEPDRLNLYQKFLKYKALGIGVKLPHKKPLYFLAGY